MTASVTQTQSHKYTLRYAKQLLEHDRTLESVEKKLGQSKSGQSDKMKTRSAGQEWENKAGAVVEKWRDVWNRLWHIWALKNGTW